MDKKAFKTLEEQVEILKERNLLFNDEVVALQFLARENYYKVMTSYKDLFLDKQEKETYLEGTNFEDIKNLYLLDRDLKSLYLKYLLIVENRFKLYCLMNSTVYFRKSMLILIWIVLISKITKKC